MTWYCNLYQSDTVGAERFPIPVPVAGPVGACTDRRTDVNAAINYSLRLIGIDAD